MAKANLATLIARNPVPTNLRDRAAALKLTAARVLPSASGPRLVADNTAAPTDWTSPPAGFVAHPAANPRGFLALELAIPAQAQRLYELAEAEFDRVAAVTDNPKTLLTTRRELHLDALHGIAHHDALSLAATPAWDGAEGLDPVFAAIASHRNARAALGNAAAETDKEARAQLGLDATAETMAETERRYDAANLADYAAWDAVIATRPTTNAGVRAWLAHLTEFRPNYEDVTDYFAAARELIDVLMPTSAPAAEPVAYEPGGEPPADLAQACDWAIQHGHWINDDSLISKADWPSERVEEEVDKADEVVDRAIAQQSRTVADMAAKARLALDEFRRHETEDDGPGQQLAAVVLREFLFLATRSAPPPALPTGQAYPRDPFYPVDRSDPVFAAYDAHQRAYGEYISHPEFGEGNDGDNARDDAERTAFTNLLHTPLTTDAGRLCYALAVIEREAGYSATKLGGYERHEPLPVAYRNLRFGEYGREV